MLPGCLPRRVEPRCTAVAVRRTARRWAVGRSSERRAAHRRGGAGEPGQRMSASRKVVAKGSARAGARSSHALREAEQRLQCVIELTADFYWEQDAEHRFAVYRPRGESDADLAGIVGKTSWEL